MGNEMHLPLQPDEARRIQSVTLPRAPRQIQPIHPQQAFVGMQFAGKEIRLPGENAVPIELTMDLIYKAGVENERL
jgi:hypothetical protein